MNSDEYERLPLVDADEVVLRRKLLDAQAELSDWRNSAQRAAAEACHDERHCTCVGPLRAQLANALELISRKDNDVSCIIDNLEGWSFLADEHGRLPISCCNTIRDLKAVLAMRLKEATQ